MIGRLRGRVVEEEATGSMILDVEGVGYELTCPVGTGARAKGEDGTAVISVHTVLRQDALELFGFASPEERAAFRLLITVPNVGPRLAISVLNVLPPDELHDVIETENKARLSKVPGIGKKTAERLVLELRGKMPLARGTDASPRRTSSAGAQGLAEQLVKALTGLGYKSAEAERAAQSLIKPEHGPGDISRLLREALSYLAQ